MVAEIVPGFAMAQDDSNETVPSPPKLLGGVLLIVIGLLFLAQGHDWMFGWHLSFSRLWPLLLIVVGIARLSSAHDPGVEARVAALAEHHPRLAEHHRPRGSHPVRKGVGIIFLGVLLLLHTNDIFPLHQTWPLGIVWAGLMVLFNRRPKSIETKTDSAAPPGGAQP
jgi:LiaI-LiaF-like transmembrane region